ncbi:LysR family transcriptional regulator [Pseudomonas luteola]|uniref:LysR family transcriptional regulator n=1 Tax=Pseudomonas luteola TaxID=47886 RepID=UPI0012388ABD|nr:LysR family transcriptional regulator [Pseudomonas luteola]QEU26723.1 LysR family transcriptional regulator [Pseudomonas luteola]
MDSFSGINAFVQAVETGSFAAAGTRLGLSPSAVGKAVARLEESLGVRLLNRNTRSLSLTDEGRIFYGRCTSILDQFTEARQEVGSWKEIPRGRLRVSLPAIGYRMLSPILPSFIERYPEVALDLDFNDRVVDVIGEGLDIVIRSGEPADSRLKTRGLGSFRFVLVAAPDYLERHGAPTSPAELENHQALLYRFPTTGQIQEWGIDQANSVKLSITGTLIFNNVEAIIDAACSGLGIAYLLDFAVRGEIESSRLKVVLAKDMNYTGYFSALWPANRHLLPKVRVFIDFMTNRLCLGD